MSRLDLTGRILVAGIGNMFLSDDGFGSEVVRQLTAPGENALPDEVQVVDYGIRGLHLAYDLLEGCAALVLVDTVPGPGAPGEIIVLEVVATICGRSELDAHRMDPVACWRVWRDWAERCRTRMSSAAGRPAWRRVSVCRSQLAGRDPRRGRPGSRSGRRVARLGRTRGVGEDLTHVSWHPRNRSCSWSTASRTS